MHERVTGLSADGSAEHIPQNRVAEPDQPLATFQYRKVSRWKPSATDNTATNTMRGLLTDAQQESIYQSQPSTVMSGERAADTLPGTLPVTCRDKRRTAEGQQPSFNKEQAGKSHVFSGDTGRFVAPVDQAHAVLQPADNEDKNVTIESVTKERGSLLKKGRPVKHVKFAKEYPLRPSGRMIRTNKYDLDGWVSVKTNDIIRRIYNRYTTCREIKRELLKTASRISSGEYVFESGLGQYEARSFLVYSKCARQLSEQAKDSEGIELTLEVWPERKKCSKQCRSDENP